MVNLKFCFADSVYLIKELRGNCLHLSNKYARIVTPSARLLNHVNKIRTTCAPSESLPYYRVSQKDAWRLKLYCSIDI